MKNQYKILAEKYEKLNENKSPFTQEDIPDWVSEVVTDSKFDKGFWDWYLNVYIKEMGFMEESLPEIIGQLLLVFVEDTLGKNPNNLSNNEYKKAMILYFNNLYLNYHSTKELYKNNPGVNIDI